MRTRRLLLAASALTTLTYCKKAPDTPPVSPVAPDAAVVTPTKLPPDAAVVVAVDAAVPAADAAIPAIAPEPVYANTKGSHYDHGAAPALLDAGMLGDATGAAADGGQAVTPPIQTPRPLPGNPKGAHYDDGLPPKPLKPSKP